jgi:uncharacterized protein (TIGR00369 family)
MATERASSTTCACNTRDLRALLKAHAFTRHPGFVVHSIALGRCCLNVPFQVAFERPGGVISGQVFMAAADVAMWLAIKTHLGLDDASVTAEMHTSFLRGGRKSAFRCTARVLKRGRRLIYGVAECRDPKGRLLAHHTITYIRQPAADDVPMPARARLIELRR